MATEADEPRHHGVTPPPLLFVSKVAKACRVMFEKRGRVPV